MNSRAFKTLERFLERETRIAERRIKKFVQPFLLREFKLAKKRCPRLLGVTFGNGMHYIYLAPDRHGREFNLLNERLPKSLETFDELCRLAYDRQNVWSLPNDLGKVK